MRFGKWMLVSIILIIGLAVGAAFILKPEYAYNPSKEDTLDGMDIEKITSYRTEAKYDYFGETIKRNQLDLIDKAKLLPENGAVSIDQELLNTGRKAFYEETFNNEDFFTDVMGLMDGPLTLTNLAKAIVKLKGEGTSNLRVELAEDFKVGDKVYKKGEKVDTGIDVPKGAYTALGMPIKFENGKAKVGVSCAACHATVDRDTHNIIEGAPNVDLDGGLLMALASNSAAFFTHGEKENVKQYLATLDEKGKDDWKKSLPDSEKFEKAVDETIEKWPAGSFDTTIDWINNPTQIPDSFTLGDHPYGWSGFSTVGPFNGLNVFSNNVHAQNTDSLSQMHVSNELFGLGKQTYLGIILQNAASAKYKFDREGDKTPEEFFKSVDPNPGVPGINELIKSPVAPKLSAIAPDGYMISSPGYNAWEQVNGMSVLQNTFSPPSPPIEVTSEEMALGEDVFNRAGCISCHAGDFYTNNRVIPVEEIGTEPSRAKALKRTELIFGEPSLYSTDTPVPLPKKPTVVRVPRNQIDEKQLELSFAHGETKGGYKVKGLLGLYWTAPYLHDGGVAVGKDNQLGLVNTVNKSVPPDPFNSLRALVDQDLRKRVIEANQASDALKSSHVTGEGHEFWVDKQTGFSREEQKALINYLLKLK
ncbi:electron transport protein [Aquibacillus kalidii]|uniref:electron transport protein n=1 Tax=Aquibacillus kalidii TaxID=2762597 RepID=UPI0016468DDE|nr:electron transport protein [Aquibacillus kalidii]